MGLDYYLLLNIPQSASQSEICRAYRRLALRYHPCRAQPGEDFSERFAAISEAYDVLSDLKKKAIYDKFGEEGLKGGAPINLEWTKPYVYHGDAHKTFMSFFGTDNPFSQFQEEMDLQVERNFGGSNGRGYPRQDPPIEREMFLSLEEIYNGCTKKMKVSRRIMNEDGHTSSMKDKILSLTVHPGWREGTRITFPKEGDQGPNTIPADIVFILRDHPHKHFKREGTDLIFTASVSLGQALLGCIVDVPTLDGRLLHVPITEIIQ
ncbi:DnaJ subfamily B member 13 isoform 1 [Schistosoma japonicum]|uniref:DnaJ subfamily B member 13 isoform 1 n=1 Tax=Schistosoma japonicum TaxID=6182 RepID=A0A4Z2CZ42_SCHJA|nr:DnaJ subfamily B member 13 isoform 1 [Schistosoma japonicum]